MNNCIKNKMFVLAFSITNIFCFGQQNRSAICKLGDVVNDSLLPYIQSLEVDCGSKDLSTFVKKSDQLSRLGCIVLKGDADKKGWTELFQKIKAKPLVKTVEFDKNTFASLPYGYEGLYNIEKISFKNNDELDYSDLLDQLEMLPNIKDLSLDVVTIFELPNKLDKVKNLSTLRIINTDESISKNETTLADLDKEPVTYDYSIKKENGNIVAVKYTAIAGEIDSDEYKELSKRFTTTSDFQQVSSAYIPKYVNVDPPLKGIDVLRTNYALNPSIENIITYPSGTKIRIPANSFSDKYGNPVTTSVTLSYREFRDPVDFLVSGIPMKYDTGGTVTNFQSAGMFEMTASTQNEPVQLAKDKKVEMNFASTSKDSTYNFYSFNDSTGNWEYLNKPKTVTAATAIPLKAPSPAYRVYRSFSYSNYLYDSTKFDKRFENTLYAYTNIKSNGGRIYYRASNRRRAKPMCSLVRIKNIRRTKEGDILFKVDYVSQAHPEMSEFSNVYFALNENMSPAEFRNKYVKRKYYNDIRVYRNGSDLELKLKDDKSIKDLTASLVTLDSKGKISDVKNINTRMKRYSRRLSNREKKFNRDIAKGRAGNNMLRVDDQKLISMYAFNQAKKSMTPDEKKMSYEEWISYYTQTQDNEMKYIKAMNAERQATVSASAAKGSNLMESLSLDGLGIYNCDQIQRMKQPVEIFAEYKTSGDKKVNAKSAYVIDKGNNSVFQYDGYGGFSAKKIAFDKHAENTLLAIDHNGEIALYTPADFQKNEFRNKSHFDFVVTKIDSKFTTVAELKALIGF